MSNQKKARITKFIISQIDLNDKVCFGTIQFCKAISEITQTEVYTVRKAFIAINQYNRNPENTQKIRVKEKYSYGRIGYAPQKPVNRNAIKNRRQSRLQTREQKEDIFSIMQFPS